VKCPLPGYVDVRGCYLFVLHIDRNVCKPCMESTRLVLRHVHISVYQGLLEANKAPVGNIELTGQHAVPEGLPKSQSADKRSSNADPNVCIGCDNLNSGNNWCSISTGCSCRPTVFGRYAPRTAGEVPNPASIKMGELSLLFMAGSLLGMACPGLPSQHSS
jgi:hypothetical protein